MRRRLLEVEHVQQSLPVNWTGKPGSGGGWMTEGQAKLKVTECSEVNGSRDSNKNQA
jgi:hypothetical protein